MGTWIAIAIVLFVLGSIMALKPSAIDVRLDKLRMTARRLELNPKLIECPEWIRGRDNEFGKGMIGQYAIIVNDMKFPETHYQVIDGKLRLDNHPHSNQNSVKSASLEGLGSMPKQALGNTLDSELIALPAPIIPLVKGVYTKANSLVVFWHDIGYVQPKTNPNFDMAQIEPDLLALKSTMEIWAQKLAAKA